MRFFRSLECCCCCNIILNLLQFPTRQECWVSRENALETILTINSSADQSSVMCEDCCYCLCFERLLKTRYDSNCVFLITDYGRYHGTCCHCLHLSYNYTNLHNNFHICMFVWDKCLVNLKHNYNKQRALPQM